MASSSITRHRKVRQHWRARVEEEIGEEKEGWGVGGDARKEEESRGEERGGTINLDDMDGVAPALGEEKGRAERRVRKRR